MESGGESVDRKSESFTSMIFRNIPSCWRTRHDHDAEDDGGFRDFCSSRPSLAQRFSSLPVTSTVRSDLPVSSDAAHHRNSDADYRLSPHHRKAGVDRRVSGYPPQSGQFWLHDRHTRHRLHPHKYLRYSASVQTFSVTQRPGLPPADGLHSVRRPHSVDLGRVSVLGGHNRHYSVNRAKLSDDFRRAGIGACLEGRQQILSESTNIYFL